MLVVEDEASIASFVSLYLKNAGYTVRTAATGSEALAQVTAQEPALVVLDLMLPDIDGIEVCRRIRKASDVPILMLTARDDVDHAVAVHHGERAVVGAAGRGESGRRNGQGGNEGEQSQTSHDGLQYSTAPCGGHQRAVRKL